MSRPALYAALGLGACAATAGQPAPAPGVSSSPAPVDAGLDPVVASFHANLKRAEDEAERAGFSPKETVEIPGHHAALVLSRASSATHSARIDAVGGGAYRVLSNQSGIIDVMHAPGGSVSWDLRGDGSSSVVIQLTPCGVSCGVAKPLVLELAGDQFFVPASAPQCPTCMHDADHDGVPEFEFVLSRLVIAPCARASCGPSAELRVEVRGLETWDGGGYARDLAALQPLYFELLKQTRHEAQGVKGAAGKAKICPLGALEVAAELVVYSRLIGDNPSDALSTADEVMRGYDTGPCAKEYELLAAPRPWSALRQELDSIELPKLGRTRH